MKVYIAGKLSTSEERERVNCLAGLCEGLGFETFLPHRDVGLFSELKDPTHIFKKDILEGLIHVDLVLASLDGLHIGAGTAWELGYAYAKGIPCIGFKTDEPAEEALDYLSPILFSSMKIFSNKEKLILFLKQFKLSRPRGSLKE